MEHKVKMELNCRSSLTCLTIVCILGGRFLAFGQQDRPRPEDPDFDLLPTNLVARAVALRERALAESRAF